MFEGFPFTVSAVPSATYPYHQQRLEPPSVGNATFAEGKMQVPRDSMGLWIEDVRSRQSPPNSCLSFRTRVLIFTEARLDWDSAMGDTAEGHKVHTVL